MSKTMTKAEINEWAEANYATSYFAQTVIECWGESDYEDIDKPFLLDLEAATNEQYNAARCDMY